MQAVKHLNSYMDALTEIFVSPKGSQKQPAVRKFAVDFVIDIPVKSKQNPESDEDSATMSARRTVELSLPPAKLCQELMTFPDNQDLRLRAEEHSTAQLVRLMSMAKLKLPEHLQDLENEEWFHEDSETLEQMHPATAWEMSRKRFMRRIDWEAVDKLYEEAVEGLKQDAAAAGLVAKSGCRRREVIAQIVSHVRVSDEEEVDTIHQGISLRRISMLLELHFDDLELEAYGMLWERCCLVLTPPRDYNSSPASVTKRKLKGHDTGFSLTLHADESATIQVPVDFHDDELVRELEANIADIHDLITANDKFESILGSV